MKILWSALVLLAITSCNNAATNPPASTDTSKKATVAVPIKPDFSAVKFDDPKDVVCGMPTKAGIEDTAHYNGKVYGFCSAGCKEEFIKDPKGYLTQK